MARKPSIHCPGAFCPMVGLFLLIRLFRFLGSFMINKIEIGESKGSGESIVDPDLGCDEGVL